MSLPSYELAGPFSEAAKHFAPEQVVSHTVKLKAERNSPHPLNPVGHLRRVVSGAGQSSQEAVLLLGVQFFEIFTIVHEQEGAPQPRASKLKSRIRSVATSATGHLPKRLRREHHVEEAGDELDTLLASSEDLDGEGALKDHVFSCGVAFAQVLRVKSVDNSVTVWYHPNTMKAAKLSKNHLATAMRFTFCLDTPEETTALLHELESRMTRYSQAALFLGQRFALPSTLHIVAITRPVAEGSAGGDRAELLLQKDAPWGITVNAPSAWGPEASGLGIPLWVYLMTPLGYGKCEISPQVVSLYRKDNDASFYVGVRHPQLSGSALTTVSNVHLLRPTDSSSSEDVTAMDDEDDESWQPEDSEEPSLTPERPERSLARQSLGSSAAQRSLPRASVTSSLQRNSVSSTAQGRDPSRQLSKSHAPSGHGVGDRHIRVHCHAKFAPASDSWSSAEGDTLPSSFQQDRSSGLSLPGGLQVSDRQLASAVAAAGLILYLFFSWSVLITLLNVGLALLTLRSRGRREGAVLADASKETTKGIWRITLIKAEVVTDEPWSAAGESIVAVVTNDDSEESAEERRKQVAAEYGFSSDVVDRYVLAFHGDETMAHRRMRATYEWKQEMGTANILSQPQPNFSFFKQMFRHGLLGVTKQGHPTWFMKVGDMKQGHKTFKESGLTQRDLARHVALCMDYMYMVIETAPLPNGRALWVLDLKGMGMSDIGSEAFEMGKGIAGMISTHWPERLHRAFIINMPGFFSILWKLVEPMLAPTTRKKIRLLRGKKDMLNEMLEEMSEEDIPAEYGGKLEGGVYAAAKEKELWAYVDSLNNKA